MSEFRNFLVGIGAIYEPFGELVNLNDRRFSVEPNLVTHIHDNGRLVYAGFLLGRTRREFIPGAGLLSELGRLEGLHKLWVDERIGWLFVCGRDIFRESILQAEGDLINGEKFLVMMGEDCIGYGVVEHRGDRMILKNVFDIGDFLRRERCLDEDR